MRSFTHFTIILIICSFLSTISFGYSPGDTAKDTQNTKDMQDTENTNDWGYIRIGNTSDRHRLHTKCYNKYGKGGRWKSVEPNHGRKAHYRSCHGAYMRVDVYPEFSTRKLLTRRIWRNTYQCKTGSLFIHFYNRKNNKFGVACF